MRKSWITLGVLLAGVIALGLFAWLKPPKAPVVTYVLSTIKPADVRTVRVLRKGKPLATLEKSATDWRLTEPVAAPAEEFQALRLIAILDAKSAQQYPAADRAKFELDVPQYEIVVNDQRFAFGAINTVTREQYVLTESRIFPVAMNYGAAVPTDVAALLRKTVLAPGDTPVRFEFATFSLEYQTNKWVATPPAVDLSQDDFNRWVAQWRDGSGLRTEFVGGAAKTPKPIGQVLITLKSGGKVSLDILQSEPELIVRRTDLGLQFVFTGNIGKQMLSPPVARK
mgnify:CR=1 FL=1